MKKTLSPSNLALSSLLILTACSLLFSQSALSDATVVYEQSAAGNKTTNTMKIKDGKIRFSPPNQPNNYSLYDSKTGSLTHVDAASKQYISMDEKSIAEQANQAKKQMDQMRERMMAKMKDMPPEQKKQVEQMMNNHLARVETSKTPPAIDQKKTSQSQTIAGITCTIYETYVQGIKMSQICMTPADQFGLSAGDAKALMSMQAFMKRMQKVAQEMMGTNLPSADLDGIPLHTTLFGKNGQVQMETKLLSVSTEALSNDTISMPADFTPMQMPGM